MAEVVKQTVGLGTQVQVVISMQPLIGIDNADYTLADLDWFCTFEGKSGKCTVDKSNAVAVAGSTDSYQCLVNTEETGLSDDIKAVLTVTNIPAHIGVRKEVTPPMSTGIEVV